jgi:hypothetical protein
VKGTLTDTITEILVKTRRSSSVWWTPTEWCRRRSRILFGIRAESSCRVHPPIFPLRTRCSVRTPHPLEGQGWRFRWHGYGHQKAYVAVQRRWSVHPDPDLNDVAAQWFFAPYFDSVTKQHGVSGMYFKPVVSIRPVYRTFPRQSHRFNEWSS